MSCFIPNSLEPLAPLFNSEFRSSCQQSLSLVLNPTVYSCKDLVFSFPSPMDTIKKGLAFLYRYPGLLGWVLLIVTLVYLNYPTSTVAETQSAGTDVTDAPTEENRKDI